MSAIQIRDLKGFSNSNDSVIQTLDYMLSFNEMDKEDGNEEGLYGLL